MHHTNTDIVLQGLAIGIAVGTCLPIGVVCLVSMLSRKDSEPFPVRWYRKGVNCVYIALALLASVAALCCAVLIQRGNSVYLLWIVFPPSWFWAQYLIEWVSGKMHKEQQREREWQWEHFKHGQQLSAACWLAVSVVLVTIASRL